MNKKIIAFLFSFSIVVSLFSVSASAFDVYGGGSGRIADFWSLSYKMWLDGQSDWNPGGIFTVGGGGRDDFNSAYSSYVSTLDSTTVSSPSEPSSYLYNGVELPPLPDWDSETYPYAYINFYNNQYNLYFTSSKAVYVVNVATFTSDNYRYRYYSRLDNWDSLGPYSRGATIGSSAVKMIWSNTDIFNVDDGSLYFSASYPVPVSSGDDIVLPDVSTRTASLMQTINNYNIDNSYTDNSTTVNYFIGSLADDGSVTDIYAPNLFDEDTMIFTDPETGTEYQAAGWLYNYETRTYGIAFDSGVLTVNDTGVDYVRLTYGDNAVTVEYFQGDAETLASSSSYAYVMASQSACNINGHTYTSETTQTPTCTVPGERKYTCSVCGNEYVEDIPATGIHSYQFSVSQEPTCTAAGIGLYTCSTCGDQYTEPIAATGHTDHVLEIVPTVYDEEGIVVSLGYTVYECTVCGYQHRVNDEIEADSESLLSGLTGAIKSFAKSAWSAIASGIGKVFSGFVDLLGGIFSFLNDTVISGVKNFFSSFSDSSILDIFQQENEDGSTTTTLPEGMSGAMATVGGFITGLPSELLGVLVFGIALLLLLAALKLLL